MPASTAPKISIENQTSDRDYAEVCRQQMTASEAENRLRSLPDQHGWRAHQP